MVINTDNLVSITEANQNFSRVARMVDENGAAVIARVKEAGIVGLGGAGFPTHVKLSPQNEVDGLLINCAEC